MGLLSLPRNFLKKEKRSIDSNIKKDSILAKLFGIPGNKIEVTPKTAIQSTAVFSSVRILANSLAMLPLHIYSVNKQGIKSKDSKHPLWILFHDKPNQWQTSFVFRVMMMTHLCLRGNAYAQIVRDGLGNILQLIPLHPDKMWVEQRLDGTFRYHYTKKDGQLVVFDPYEILHLKGFTEDGVMGISPIEAAARAIGLNLEAEDLAERFYLQNATPSGIIKFPNDLSTDARNKVREDWQDMVGGKDNAYRPPVLTRGMEYQQIGISFKDSQWLEAREFSIPDITTRIFGIPGRFVGDKTDTSTLEDAMMMFVTFGLQPWITCWEQEVTKQIILPSKQFNDKVDIKFSVKGLLRGNSIARASFYRQLFGVGALSINEIREYEDEERLEEGGDMHFVPLNMADVAKVASGEIQPGANKASQFDYDSLQADDKTPKKEPVAKRTFEKLFTREFKRIVAREVKSLTPMAKNPDFLVRSNEFFEKHEAFVADSLASLVEGYDEMRGNEKPIEAKTAAKNYVFRSTSELIEGMKAGKDVSELLNSWLETRAEVETRHILDFLEGNQHGN